MVSQRSKLAVFAAVFRRLLTNINSNEFSDELEITDGVFQVPNVNDKTPYILKTRRKVSPLGLECHIHTTKCIGDTEL